MTDPRLDLINRVLAELPTPLVGSVAYDGEKQNKLCTQKAFDAFADCYTLVRPRHMLEVGTHAGGSALMGLAFTDASIVSVDIGHTWITPAYSFTQWGELSTEGGLEQVARVLSAHFPGRFTSVVGDSIAPGTRGVLRDLHVSRPFDTAFIDGDHSYPFVKADIQFARELGIRDILLDDYNGGDSEVAQAAREEGLTLVKEWTKIHSSGCGFALMRAG